MLRNDIAEAHNFIYVKILREPKMRHKKAKNGWEEGFFLGAVCAQHPHIYV